MCSFSLGSSRTTTTTIMATHEIWFRLIDFNHKPIESPVTTVVKNIVDLKRKAKVEHPNILKNFLINELVVWRCKEVDWTLNEYQQEQAIGRINFSDKNQAIILENQQKIKDLEGFDEDEILLVQLPSAFPPSSFNLPPFSSDSI